MSLDRLRRTVTRCEERPPCAPLAMGASVEARAAISVPIRLPPPLGPPGSGLCGAGESWSGAVGALEEAGKQRGRADSRSR